MATSTSPCSGARGVDNGKGLGLRKTRLPRPCVRAGLQSCRKRERIVKALALRDAFQLRIEIRGPALAVRAFRSLYRINIFTRWRLRACAIRNGSSWLIDPQAHDPPDQHNHVDSAVGVQQFLLEPDHVFILCA